jgi:hypothetical protein
VRLVPLVLVALVLVGCSDDDDGEPQAQGVTTSTDSTDSTTVTSADAPDDCDGADPVPPEAADGSPAEIVATSGDLAFAVVDRGASVDVVAIFATVDCAYEPVLLDREATAFAVGGSVTHGDGIRCDGSGQLTVLSATSDDGATYQATAVTYEVDGTALVETDRQATTIEAGEDPDGLAAYYRLDC